MAVDVFFRTLADTHGAHAASIVLSGADGDGAIGLKRIKERGGLTIAQDPDEAEHEGMPRSAIATGMVDWVLKAQEIPARLLEYFAREKQVKLPREESSGPTVAAPTSPDAQEADLREVLAFLRTRTDRDLSYYKRATVLRRISRRMQINSMDSLPEYLTFLRTHQGESSALLQDMLISVTNFFRDREAFAALETHLPQLFRGKKSGDTVRVWVAACASGEEAYSVAMLLSEHARTLDAPPQVQVFATDLAEVVVQSARDGVYPAAIVTDVSEERLARFFVKEHRGYRVRRELRETVLFAQHDLLKDSPFSKLDLVTCRNLLIYLNRDAQRRTLDIFHFSLVRHRRRTQGRPRGTSGHQRGVALGLGGTGNRPRGTPVHQRGANTVNAELKSRVDELGRSNGDLHNLMAATNVATVFLDRELQITRYTPSAVALFSLIPTDVGRPLTDLQHRLDYPELEEDARQVLAQLIPVEREVHKRGNGWFLARLQPYRTVDDHIAGVVLTFVDITERREARERLQASEARLRRAIEIDVIGIIFFRPEDSITYANDAFLYLSGYTREDVAKGLVRWGIFTGGSRRSFLLQYEHRRGNRHRRPANPLPAHPGRGAAGLGGVPPARGGLRRRPQRSTPRPPGSVAPFARHSPTVGDRIRTDRPHLGRTAFLARGKVRPGDDVAAVLEKLAGIAPGRVE